jgi:hypothetical protein
MLIAEIYFTPNAESKTKTRYTKNNLININIQLMHVCACNLECIIKNIKMKTLCETPWYNTAKVPSVLEILNTWRSAKQTDGMSLSLHLITKP